jgi:hypothetical protein
MKVRRPQSPWFAIRPQSEVIVEGPQSQAYHYRTVMPVATGMNT